MTMSKCPEFSPFADPSLLLKNKTNHQLPNLGHPHAMHCKAKNFKNDPSPLCFPFCFSSLPTDAWGTTSPDFFGRKLSPSGNSSLLPPPPNLNVVLGARFPTMLPSDREEKEPDLLLASLQLTPRESGPDTHLQGEGVGGADPLPTDRRPDVPDQAPARFQGLQFQENNLSRCPTPWGYW